MDDMRYFVSSILHDEPDSFFAVACKREVI